MDVVSGAGRLASPMSRSTLRLRVWQRKALDAFLASSSTDFLAVATPGAGKTTFALTAARMSLPNLPGRLVVVAPTRHLKDQWADAAQRFQLHLVVDWAPGDLLPADAHGVVVTYQQIGSSPEPFFALSQGGFVILDEIHHAGDDRSWGDGVRTAFDGASRRLALSGTPFRSDTQAIPFVTYADDEVVPDIEYGYGEAIRDGRVVRPVYFPRFGGHMEWTAPDGAQFSATFDDPLARSLANQRLRAALSLDGDWLPEVLTHAHDQLMAIRETHVDAGGLVIATDQDHARGIARLLRTRFGVEPVVATSEDPAASTKISRFVAGTDPWIVAVRMISEGVDIPRLRVGVYATTTTTELFFRQAVGRVVRFIPGGGRQKAYVFLPDDFRLRKYATGITESRKHSLVKKERDGAELDEIDRPVRAEADQMSLFAVHAATASEIEGDDMLAHDVLADPDGTSDESVGDDSESDDPELVIDLGELPTLGVVGSSIAPSGRANDRNERERLRRINTDLAKELVGLTGRTHAAVNGELNRRARVTKISEATIVQLNRRARAAEEWVRTEQRRKRYADFR